MTKEVKQKGYVMGAGVLLYFIAWLVTEQAEPGKREEILLFFFPYAAFAFYTCGDFLKRIKALHFPDENFLVLIATAGAFAVGRYKEAVGAMLFYQAGRLIEELSLSRTRKSIEEFIDIRPGYANLKEETQERVVSPENLQPGQVIILRPGERIPVDAVVTAGSGTVDEKALTGEAEPRTVEPGERLYSGSINLSGVLEAEVEKPYSESTASRIMELVQNTEAGKSDRVLLADQFTRYYTPAVILIALLTMLLPPMMFAENRSEWIYRGLVILVAACPCGLMISVPLAFLGGIGAASRKGVLIKGAVYLESLAETDTFVFDKTGTLTEGVFHVTEIVPRGCTGEELLETAVLGESGSVHPIAVSLRNAYGKKTDRSRVSETENYPGYGLRAKVDGKTVYIGNSRLMKRQGLAYQPVEEEGTAVHVSVEGRYAGYILISDVIREDAGRLMHWLHRRGIGTVMLTGDNERTAEKVAGKLGIESVYAELMPEDKVEQIEEFMESQTEGEKVAFVGDGINDAPVLARADLGIAMGGLGADAALEAADIILMEDEPSGIIYAVRIAEATLRSVNQNLIFAIGMKIFLILLAFPGFVTMQNAILADAAVMLISILNSFWMLKYPE